MRLTIAIHQFVQNLVTKGRIPSQPPGSTGCQELEQVIEQLTTLNRSTEHDFLAIGARLMEFLSMAEGISSGIGAAVQEAAGEQGARASHVLEQALARCRALVAATSTKREHLAILQHEASRLGTLFGGFRQAVASFHVVCTMTRIEAARLGGEGDELGSLTDEVLTLARRMQAQVERVLEAATAIDRQVATIAFGLRGANQLLDHLALTIPSVLHHLDTFEAQQEAAAILSTELAGESRIVSRAIMNAVTSIQFHDITRQQIEHVIAALEHVSAQANNNTLPYESASALTLEATQLTSADATFQRSVTRLWSDLDSLSVSVRGMAVKGQTMIDGHANDSVFFLAMQQCLDDILEAVAANRDAESATHASTLGLTPLLDTMNAAAAEIRSLDVQLLRVALNANLRASHLGPRGDTLAILASTLQDLATSANERSRDAALALASMEQALTQLTCMPHHEKDEALTLGLRSTMDTLRRASEAGAHRIREIAASASSLGEGITLAHRNFHAGRLFAETVPPCLAQLEALAQQALTKAPALLTAGPTLEAFTRTYTMQSERDIHASLTDSLPLTTPCLVTAGDSEFGDNVDLF